MGACDGHHMWNTWSRTAGPKRVVQTLFSSETGIPSRKRHYPEGFSANRYRKYSPEKGSDCSITEF